MLTERLTNDAKDAQDVWGEDNKHVDEGQQDEGDPNMAKPAEGFIREDHLLDGPSHLSIKEKKESGWKLLRFIFYFICFSGRNMIHVCSAAEVP